MSWFLICGAAARDPKVPVPNSAIAVLHTAKPAVGWDAKTAVSADVTCDGKPDTVVIGYEKKKEVAWLGVVPGSDKNRASRPITMSFLVGKHTQDSFCSLPVQIKTGPIECDDNELGALPGCKRVKGCSDFSIVDTDCDSFYFYWDSSHKKLAWWRR